MSQTMQSQAYSQQVSAGWTPSTGLTMHNGDPIPPTMDFCVPPPAEIGELFSASSTLSPTTHPKTPWFRWALAGSIFLVIWLGMEIVASSMGLEREGPRLFGLIAGLILALIAFVMVRFTHSVNYVGTQGAASFAIRGSRENIKPTYFLFNTAAELRTAQTRHFYNGVYTGTSYAFTWTDENGAQRFKLSGQYRSKEGTPKWDSPFWFARACEVSWNNHLINTIQQQLDQYGFIQFNLTRSNFVRVGVGFMEFCFGNEVNRVTQADIKNLNINSGTFQVHTHDAKWFSRKGKFSFQYGNMANARMFLFAMEKLIGYRF